MLSHDELLEGYLAHAEAVAHERKDTNFWAFNELADLMRDDPDGAWQIIVGLVGRASDEETLGYVAAGPLEDLICQHPEAMIDRVESRAGQDARFRKAIARVWGWTRMPKEIRARLDLLVAEERRRRWRGDRARLRSRASTEGGSSTRSEKQRPCSQEAVQNTSVRGAQCPLLTHSYSG